MPGVSSQSDEGRNGGREGGREAKSNPTCIRRTQRPVEGGKAMHMLRGVLQVPLSFILVFSRKYGDGLETAPAEGENDGVVGLEDLREGGRGDQSTAHCMRYSFISPSLLPSLPCDATDASSPYT